MVTREDFRNAMSRLAAAVQVVTTDGPAGRAGFTATAVCSVTDTPPRLLVCLNAGASSYPFLAGNGRLCVNVLSESQSGIATDFGGRLPREKRFERGDWRQTAGGAWALEGALASFDCVVADCLESGSHTVFIADVLACTTRSDATPLIYADRRFTTIHSAPVDA